MSEAAIRPATPADALAIAQVRVDAWRTTYRGLMPAAYLAAMKVEDSHVLWNRVLTAAPNTTSTVVATVDGQVVGFASALMLAEPKFGLDAELSAIYLDRDRQRAGLGTGLRAGVFWRDMGVINQKSGKPTLALTGGALARLQLIMPAGMTAQIDLSITDENPLAQAVVIISAVPVR